MTSTIRRPRTAVIPVAGRGTRMSALTRAVPKELLPLGGRLTIDLIVDELLTAGFSHIVFVSRPDKRALNDHLETSVRRDAADRGATVQVIDQTAGPGNGGAILSAQDLLDDAPFLVVWGDEVFLSGPTGQSRAEQVTRAFMDCGSTTVALVRAPRSVLPLCGVALVDGADPAPGDARALTALIEKPAHPPTGALASVGGYLLTPDVLRELASAPLDASGELSLSSALRRTVERSGVRGVVLDSRWHETGSPAGYARAFAAVADEQGLLQPAG